MSPWSLELHLARTGPSAAHARALSRDAARGLLVRVRPGVYADAAALESFGPEARHVVAVRAFAAVAPRPPVFSHWSAAVLLGLPAQARDLTRVHVAVRTPSGRGLAGVAAHLVPRASEAVAVGTLLATGAVPTVVDIARTAPFSAGVVVADGALRSGLSRQRLIDGVRDASSRPGARRAQAVLAFARSEAESVAESLSRECMMRLGVAPPVLQHEVHDALGLAGRLDFWWPRVRAGGEVDGVKKYLDPVLAPGGAGRAVVAEKWREDRVRREIDRLARWGWPESSSPSLLAPILRGAGVLPSSPRSKLADYCTPFLSDRL